MHGPNRVIGIGCSLMFLVVGVGASQAAAEPSPRADVNPPRSFKALRIASADATADMSQIDARIGWSTSIHDYPGLREKFNIRLVTVNKSGGQTLFEQSTSSWPGRTQLVHLDLSADQSAAARAAKRVVLSVSQQYSDPRVPGRLYDVKAVASAQFAPRFASTPPQPPRVTLPRGCNIDTDLIIETPTGHSLANCNLAGVDLNGAMLYGLAVPGANLTGAKFRGAELGNADLSHATLNDADFARATMVSADLYRATMQRTILNYAVLSRANISHADGNLVEFEHATMHVSNLTKAKMLAASFNHADLRNSSFTGATLFDSTFVAAKCADVDWVTGKTIQSCPAGPIPSVR